MACELDSWTALKKRMNAIHFAVAIEQRRSDDVTFGLKVRRSSEWDLKSLNVIGMIAKPKNENLLRFIDPRSGRLKFGRIIHRFGNNNNS